MRHDFDIHYADTQPTWILAGDIAQIALLRLQWRDGQRALARRIGEVQSSVRDFLAQRQRLLLLANAYRNRAVRVRPEGTCGDHHVKACG